MTTIAFRGMGVNAAAFGFGQSNTFLQIAIFVGSAKDGQAPRSASCGEVANQDDASSGSIKNKILSYGWNSCTTAPGGHRVGLDTEGRPIPLFLDGKYIELSADCGTLMASESVDCAVKFAVKERMADGNTGATLYSFDGRMPISAGRLSSDFAISGMFRRIQDESFRSQLATTLYSAATGN